MNNSTTQSVISNWPVQSVPTTPGLIYKKMSDVMKEIGAITKDKTNSSQGSGFKFRGIDQFVNAMYPALTKHGVFMAPECVSETHEVKEVVRSSGKAGLDKYTYIQMCYRFYAEDGSSVLVGPIPAEGLDSGDKATNKALSAALKYALIQTFSVPTEDMAEGDSETPVMGTNAPVAPPSASIATQVAEVPKKTSSFRKSATTPAAAPEAPKAPVTTSEEWS